MMDEALQGSSSLSRVGRQEYGYNLRQVDSFLARTRDFYTTRDSSQGGITSAQVRSMAFDPAKGGYEPQAVDAVLDRLEDAFAERERQQMIESEGKDAWQAQIDRTTVILRGRLTRAPGDRFRRPTRKKATSYNADDVDALCDRLLAYLGNNVPLDVDVVRRAVFREVRGAEGYEETQVDAFLDRVVALMTATG